METIAVADSPFLYIFVKQDRAMDARNLDPAAIETFLAAAETSFSEAARRRNLTRSAVTQTIERLEKHWQVTLFDRTRRPVKLTAAGVAAAGLAKRYLAEARFFEDQLRALAGGAVTSLRFAVSEVAQSFAGADLEAALLPTVAVFTARTGLIPAVTAAFQKGEVDLAVVPDLPEKDRMLARRLMTERYCLVTPKVAVPTDCRTMSELTAAFELPFVSYRSESLDWQKSQRMLRLLGLAAGRSVALENTAAVAGAVASGLGWTILPPMNLWCLGARLSDVTIHPVGTLSAEKTLWAAVKDAAYEPHLTLVTRVFTERMKTRWLPQMTALKPAVADFVSL